MSGREDGYTIIEALCAFAILAVVLVTLYGLGGTSLRMLAVSSDADRVALLAQSKLDELAATRAPLPGFQIGQFDRTDVRWKLEANELPKADTDVHELHLQNLRLTLTWPALTGSNELVVSGRHMGIERQ
jgi:Prokaryotic N-terminal methylation motif